MKAEEIRKYQIAQGRPVEFAIALLLREATAQLADLNEHLRLVDSAVFGSPSPKKETEK